MVIIVQPKLPNGYDVLGVGQVVGAQDLQIGQTIPVLVAAVEAIASGIISIGQVVTWPRKHLAIPQVRQEETSRKENQPKLPSPMSDMPPENDDRVMNYALQCIQLGVMLMQLNDTEKEGDGERSLINWKLLMLYFRSRKHGMKYAYEAMRLITCVKGLYTKQMAHRVTHGQFVNGKGVAGNNCANDLRMEMLIKHYKVILKGMCGNKTLKAVERSSAAAYGLNKIIQSYDITTDIPPDSTSHTHTSTVQDIKEMITLFHNKAPFSNQPGRAHRSFPTISKSPLDQLDVSLLHSWLTRHKKRLAKNYHANCDDAEDDDELIEDVSGYDIESANEDDM